MRSCEIATSRALQEYLQKIPATRGTPYIGITLAYLYFNVVALLVHLLRRNKWVEQ